MLESIILICQQALQLAGQTLADLGQSGTVVAKGKRKADIITRGDILIAEALRDFFRAQKFPARLLSEELGQIDLFSQPAYTVAIDDLDGTDNYCRGRGILPYCTVITVFSGQASNFRGACVAGVIEHRSRQTWLAIGGHGCIVGGRQAEVSRRRVLDRHTAVTVDLCGSGDEVGKLLPVLRQAWVKDFGLSAFMLAGVASGMFDAFVSPAVKAHELGAGYLLVKEAGGVISDWQGQPLHNMPYDFNGRYPVVAAGTKILHKRLLAELT